MSETIFLLYIHILDNADWNLVARHGSVIYCVFLLFLKRTIVKFSRSITTSASESFTKNSYIDIVRSIRLLNMLQWHKFWVKQYIVFLKRKFGGFFPNKSTTNATSGAMDPDKSYFRLPLPKDCIDYSSREGKVLFLDAMKAGTMERYFKVAAKFKAQSDPYYCGFDVLAMCLDVLEADPGCFNHDGLWLWHHQEMLSCQAFTNSLRNNGISLEQFVGLAEYSGLEVSRVLAGCLLSCLVNDLKQVRTEFEMKL